VKKPKTKRRLGSESLSLRGHTGGAPKSAAVAAAARRCRRRLASLALVQPESGPVLQRQAAQGWQAVAQGHSLRNDRNCSRRIIRQLCKSTGFRVDLLAPELNNEHQKILIGR